MNEKEKLAFVKVYMQRHAGNRLVEGYDFHQEFADELGICRQEAKVLFYKLNYSLDLSLLNSMKRGGNGGRNVGRWKFKF